MLGLKPTSFWAGRSEFTSILTRPNTPRQSGHECTLRAVNLTQLFEVPIPGPLGTVWCKYLKVEPKWVSIEFFVSYFRRRSVRFHPFSVFPILVRPPNAAHSKSNLNMVIPFPNQPQKLMMLFEIARVKAPFPLSEARKSYGESAGRLRAQRPVRVCSKSQIWSRNSGHALLIPIVCLAFAWAWLPLVAFISCYQSSL